MADQEILSKMKQPHQTIKVKEDKKTAFSSKCSLLQPTSAT
jgi:hypothetical protein